MTTEQAIILAFLAAAFVAGWVVRSAVGGRRSEDAATAEVAASLEEPMSTGHQPIPRFAAPAAAEGQAHESRNELTRAVRAYHAAVVRSLPNGKRDGSDVSALEALARALVALARAVDHESQQLEGRHPLAARLQATGLELQRLADDVFRHSREQEVPAGVFDQLEEHLISLASIVFAPDRLEAQPT